jgi:hypothetical protein
MIDRPESKKPVKKPKILQVFTGKDGLLAGVVYDNGRVFLWTYTKTPNQYDCPVGEGYWGELTYPSLEEISVKPAEFVECNECRRKPGSPALCTDCLRRRDKFYGSKKT